MQLARGYAEVNHASSIAFVVWKQEWNGQRWLVVD